MPFEEEHPTLVGIMAWIPVKMAVKKQLFGGRYIRLWDYCAALGFQYESGAILGRARRDKLNVMAKMLAPEKIADELIKDLHDEASNRLNQYRNEIGKEPSSFHEFISMRQLDRLLGAVGYTWIKLCEEYTRGNKGVVKIFDHKVSLELALRNLRMYGLEGIGFGSSFPELTEGMYKNASENVDLGSWAEVRAFGVDIPEKPDVIPFEEREESILVIAAAFATEFHPELVDTLELRGLLNKG